MTVVAEFATYRAARDSVITIGVFDGVHRGHCWVIGQMLTAARARSALATVVTFDPPPRQVLAIGAEPSYLTTLNDRISLIARLGVDVIVILRFDRAIARTPASAFVEDLARRFQATELLLGPDFALGRDREGSVSVLARLGEPVGMAVRSVEPLLDDGTRISSTQIRRLIQAGEIARAADLLGRAPTVTGQVIRGVGRGRRIGIPTANLKIDRDFCLPANGVYAALARTVDAQLFVAAVNIGIRPSFDAGERSIEAHLIGADLDLYGQYLNLEFLARLRGEQKFASVESLVAQIQADVARARDIGARALAEHSMADHGP